MVEYFSILICEMAVFKTLSCRESKYRKTDEQNKLRRCACLCPSFRTAGMAYRTMRKNVISFFKKGVANLTLLAVLATNLICSASAFEVPVSSTEVEVNGQKILTEVYETGRALEPETLIKGDFQRAGFTYTFDKIVKEEAEATETRDVTHNVQKQSKTDNLTENIKLFDSSIPYIDKDGFEGTLYLDVDTIKTEADGYTKKSRNVSTTKTYTGLQYNDPTLIPSTVDKDGQTLNLQDVKWDENTLVENGSVPSTYTATATYSKTSSVSVATGYTITATYVGTASLDKHSGVTYTVSYIGSLIPESEAGEEEPKPENEPEETAAKPLLVIDANTALIMMFIIILVLFVILFVTMRKQKQVLSAQAWQTPPPQLLPPPQNMNMNQSGYNYQNCSQPPQNPYNNQNGQL